MVWKETCVMDERMSFIAACVEGEESVSELCRHFGISRKTGHKWLGRYAAEGVSGLEDRSRAPHGNSRSLDVEVVEAVLAVRHRYRSWGPRKRRRRVQPQSFPFSACRAANDVWCADFKGWFLTGDGTHVEPLTLSDGHSRYLLRCQAVGRADDAHVWPVFEACFHEFGLPLAVRSDNGPPFASRAVAGLSRLAVKLIKVGVKPERIEPGKPQQNGRHERMHLTLKQETASPPARSLGQQMARFDSFRETYNHERPHEALGQVPPATLYRPSPRPFDDVLIRKVRRGGEIKWRGNMVFVSEVLAGEPVGLHDIGNDVWLLKYGPVVLGTLRGEGNLKKIGPGSRSRPNPYRDKT